MSICEQCILRDTVQIEGKLIPVCSREQEFSEAVKSYGKDDCLYFITKPDLIQIQDCKINNKDFDSLVNIYDSFYDHFLKHYDILRSEQIAHLSLELTKFYFDYIRVYPF